jgi:hypothetical protein
MTDQEKDGSKKDRLTEERSAENGCGDREDSKKSNVLPPCFGSNKSFSGFFLVCLVSSVVSVFFVIILFRLGGEDLFFENRQTELFEKQRVLSKKIQELDLKIKSLGVDFTDMKTEIGKGKENDSYIYSSIAGIQEDISIIKSLLHVSEPKKQGDDSLDENISAELATFISGFQALVKDGAPFEGYYNANKTIIDVSDYETWPALVKYQSTSTPSIAVLEKKVNNLAKNEFGINTTETFLRRQVRILKEKFCNAIRISKKDLPNLKEENETINIGEVVAKAVILIRDGRLEEAVQLFETIEESNQELLRFVQDAKSRLALDKAFAAFAEEFKRKESRPASHADSTPE